jgi:twitching motility protein PilT
LETVRTAITAAETGHLVIGTLHTIDAPKSIDRLIDVFPEGQQNYVRAQLANCLLGIVSQRLLRRATKEGGVVLCSEVMVANDAIRSCIREGKIEQLPSLMQIGRKDGMHTIDDSLATLLKNGDISPDDALAHCRDKNHLQQVLSQIPKKGGWFR